jgi:hypothetical protein
LAGQAFGVETARELIMKPAAFITMLYQPAAVRERAADLSAMSAAGINAVYGMLVFTALAPLTQSMFTVGFVVAGTLLFGPLLGFIVSSLYPRLEMTVGRRLGGKATFDELYRLFAWSFLPTGLALGLLALLFSSFDRTSTVLQWSLFIPVLILICCGIRNYCSNIIAAQSFTLLRGHDRYGADIHPVPFPDRSRCRLYIHPFPVWRR